MMEYAQDPDPAYIPMFVDYVKQRNVALEHVY